MCGLPWLKCVTHDFQGEFQVALVQRNQKVQAFAA
jgi:hypothetical protein